MKMFILFSSSLFDILGFKEIMSMSLLVTYFTVLQLMDTDLPMGDMTI